MSELSLSFIPKGTNSTSLITMSLIAQVLRQNVGWIQCGEIAEQVLNL